MTANKMNAFLQRMLKKNEELNASNDNESEKVGQKKNETGRSGSSKGNWIKKLGNHSPNKYQVPVSPVRTNAMKTPDKSVPCNNRQEGATPPRSSESPQTPLEMPDLESIIRDFETGFRSPSKQHATGSVDVDSSKQRNFVKKIVAAFEVKYKTYNDLRTAQEINERREMGSTPMDASRRKSRLFDGPFRNNNDESKHPGKLDDSANSKQRREDTKAANGESEIFSTHSKNNSKDSKGSRRSGIFGTPFNVASNETKDPDNSGESAKDAKSNENRRSGVFCTPSKVTSENSRNPKKSKIVTPPFGRTTPKKTNGNSSEIYTYPVDVLCQDSKDSSSDSSSLFKFDKEESRRRSNFHFSPPRMSFLDDTKILDSIDLDVTLPEPEETILLQDDTLPKTSTMINDVLNHRDGSEARQISGVDNTPKIVGAYLKKPIEVKDTSIDWIPITGKKLPRKRSLKKLLCSLTGKKSFEKRGKMFSSERNLYEESRELQDSGYDEKSCSSSSLNSLISITEVLLQQENSYIEPERRTTLSTFKSRRSSDEGDEDSFYDVDSGNVTKRKLLLTEVPREDVKLDLGPSYPSSTKMLTMSLDRRMICRKTRSPSPVYARLTSIPKHPFLSKKQIPKHPFVSVTKMDEPQEFHSSQEFHSTQESVIIKNDLYEVEFRRSCADIYSSASCRSSSSVESNYDVPRRFLSKSENEISTICRPNATNGEEIEPVYDVPRTRTFERPKSSVYEDAVSLRRRSTHLDQTNIAHTYAVPRNLKIHRATVKPRNSRICPNDDISCVANNLAFAEKRCSI